MNTADSDRRRLPRWSLSFLLFLFIPFCAVLAYYGHVHRQQQRAIDAYQLMSVRGVDANFSNGLRQAVYTFRNGNVTDDDLDAFSAAFNGYAPVGFGQIETIRLNGSKVSRDAAKRFRQAVRNCKLEP